MLKFIDGLNYTPLNSVKYLPLATPQYNEPTKSTRQLKYENIHYTNKIRK